MATPDKKTIFSRLNWWDWLFVGIIIGILFTMLFPSCHAWQMTNTSMDTVFNEPIHFDNSTGHIAGSINGTPFQGDITGNLSVISQPVAWDIWTEMIILIAVLLVWTAVMVTWIALYFTIMLRHLFREVRK